MGGAGHPSTFKSEEKYLKNFSKELKKVIIKSQDRKVLTINVKPKTEVK